MLMGFQGINIGHLKISRDYFGPQIFRKEMDNMSIIILCTLSKMFQFVEIIVVLLTKIYH